MGSAFKSSAEHRDALQRALLIFIPPSRIYSAMYRRIFTFIIYSPKYTETVTHGIVEWLVAPENKFVLHLAEIRRNVQSHLYPPPFRVYK